MSSLVSVVVTCYNHEEYIEECLQSIFEQTYRNIELLVIDDGSTDKSGEIIKHLLTHSPFNHTKYLFQSNSGLVASRNKAFNYITGDFLLFVDSDNFLPKNYIECLKELLITSNADIAYGNLFDPEKKELFMESRPYSLDSLLLGNYIDSCSLIRTSIIGTVRYDDELNRKKLEDYDFFLQLIIYNDAKPIYCPEINLNYRVLGDSLSRKEEHKAEAYYYSLYLYILKKFLQPANETVYEAVKTTVMTLEGRLSELIVHLDEVTDYVHELEGEKARLDSNVNNLTEELSDTKDEKYNLEKEIISLESNLSKLEKKNSELIIINQEIENQKNQILHSVSYNIGNRIVKPVRFIWQIVSDPKQIRPFLGRVKRFLARKSMPIRHPQKFLLRGLRHYQRNKNNYTDPSRVLIYVIYEDKPRLQEFKVIFLEKLSKLCDDVLIVVNGDLDARDQERLKEFGEVIYRENQGYDAAAFRYGIQYLGRDTMSKYDELLLVNDTNVGPFIELEAVFQKMDEKKVDFWGITYGEAQPDFTGYNKYLSIPVHLQSFFLVIKKSMFDSKDFFTYWNELTDTNSRNKAIGKHETVFTTHFEHLGYSHDAITKDNEDSGIYIHPLKMLKAGVPLVKYSAFANYDNDKFAWQGLIRQTEVPDLIDYIRKNTNYPMNIIDQIMYDMKHKENKEHILIIDGVEGILPQLTKYRVDNKVEQLESLGYNVWKVNASTFQMGYAEHASHIIIYRAPYTDTLGFLCKLAKKYNKPVLYDIDDLVIDTKYTDLLSYTQQINSEEKAKYDAGVNSYGTMLKLCDGAITTTAKLKEELLKYHDLVLLNRNLASEELVEISSQYQHVHNIDSDKIKIGYFSGSITHNENFNLIRNDLIKLMNEFDNLELHLVGYLDLPEDLKKFKDRIVINDFVDWKELPKLIGKVDINLAPLVDSVFNEAKSEIKWLEAALVNVPTIASNIGSFREMIEPNVTGILIENQWYHSLKQMIMNPNLRENIATSARLYVLDNCTTNRTEDELTFFIRSTQK